jgi:hypothetical protein
MPLIARLFVVLIAYLLACVAASIVLTIGTLTPHWDQLMPQEMPAAALWVVIGAATVFIGAVALLPSFLIIALAEGFAWRSAIFYGVLGGIVALALTYGNEFARFLDTPGGVLAHQREVFAASGIAGGLVYWAFAGRKAGAWKS